MKLLRQILGRNSICRGDELCDRVEREERRMKGQEEKRSRVAAPGLMVHYDPTLSPLLFVSLHFHSECMCGGNNALDDLSFTNGPAIIILTLCCIKHPEINPEFYCNSCSEM